MKQSRPVRGMFAVVAGLDVAEVTDQNGKKHHARVNEAGTLMPGLSARRQDSANQSTTK